MVLFKRYLILPLLLVNLVLSLQAQHKVLTFRNISTAQGLSHTNVIAVLEDSKGFVWFGTRDGLNKYDGYKFTVYKNDPQNERSISSNHIRDLYEDKDGFLWIATFDGGLNRYDPNTNTFIRFVHNPKDKSSISSNNVEKLYVDSKENFWIGTGQGLNLFNKTNKTFTYYKHNALDSNSLVDNKVLRILEDETGMLWVGTENGGLDVFDREKKIFFHYPHDPNNPSSLSENYISALFEDKEGNFWVGTKNRGFNLYDRKTKSFKRYRHDLDNDNSLGHNSVSCINEDNEGNLWIGTENGGLTIFNKRDTVFSRYVNDQNDKRSLSNNSLWSIYKDRKGNMWIGTYSGGVDFLDVEPPKFQLFQNQPNNPNSLSNNNVLTLFEEDGTVWIGTDGGGVNRFERRINKFYHYIREGNSSRTLGSDYIISLGKDEGDDLYIGSFQGGVTKLNTKNNSFERFNPENTGYHVSSILQDKKGYLWLGTWGYGLKKYDKRNNSFQDYFSTDDNPDGLIHNVIFCLFEDSRENFWIGTEGKGLDLFDRQTEKFTHFIHDDANPESLSNNVVNVIFEDSKGNLWVGTNGGLNLFNRNDKTFTKYRQKEGLPNDMILGILEDNRGNLWISTNKGLSCFNYKTQECRNYDMRDGLQSNAFSRGACFKNNKGEMFFGGPNGFNIFHPDSIKDNSFIPPVYITEFQIFNTSVTVGAVDSPLKQHITQTEEIELSYKESVISFEFAALNYTLPEKNQYAYKLEGFDREWNYIGTERKVTYTNLDPGEYVFKVKASNNDGVWGKHEKQLLLKITPPFWRTWWFKSLIVLLVVGSSFSFFQLRIRTIKVQKENLEKQVQQRTIDLKKANIELFEKSKEIQVQRDDLKKVNENVMNSIYYANTIQKAILPTTEKIQGILSDFFVIYKPKDVVSGDFFWFSHFPQKKQPNSKAANVGSQEVAFLAAIDCTGHGVPGAFMSIIGNTLFNEIVNQKHVFAPSEILEMLDLELKSSINPSEGIHTAGMDVCLCKFEKGEPNNKVKITFAGARRPLFYIRKGSKEVEKVQGSIISIGSEFKEENMFESNELILEEGSVIYLTTDGFADQNSPKNEKFGTSRLKKLMETLHHLPMRDQKVLFERALDEHQREAYQRDDITIIGVRV